MVSVVSTFAEPSTVPVPVTSPEKDIVLPVAHADAVLALPSRSAINVPFVQPDALVLTVVVGSVAVPENNLNFPDSLASQFKPAYL